ncbi:MAG: hypothetical protein OEY63_00810 [Gemmatimonadota bacterium]|nr:hypothetical protein [Gemmatimonadota bacterium]MDH5804859.1 hypothetical protein [Gemmatimonadota bacterium]
MTISATAEIRRPGGVGWNGRRIETESLTLVSEGWNPVARTLAAAQLVGQGSGGM